MRLNSKILMLGTALVAMSQGSLAYGETATGASTNDDNAIVVTANKRVENANKVGLTMSVLSSDALAERQIASLSDIASAVPGLTYASSTANTPIYTLRGVGFNESSLGVYPAVSVYVDQQALPFPVLASHSAFDLERIEVLKGPQGTLFGQNATGGAINFIAAKPTKTLQAGGDITYGRFNEISGNAFISGPLTDTLGFRIAATGEHADGWQYSVTRPGDSNGATSYVAGRLLLDWKPVDALRFELNLNGFNDKSQPQAQQLVAILPQGLNAVSAAPANANGLANLQLELQQQFSNLNARSANWVDQALDPATAANVTPVVYAGPGANNNNGAGTASGAEQLTSFRPFSNRKMYQIALRSDLDVTDGITLTSLTSYNHFTQTQATNGDGMDIVSFDLQKGAGYIHNFNQELRLANTGNSAVKWVIGGNYEKTTTNEDQLLRYFNNSNYNAANDYINASGVVNEQSIRNLAAFGNIEYQVLDQLKLIAGARYTDSKNDANICSYTITGGNVDKLFGTSSPAACYTYLLPSFTNGVPYINSLKEHNVSWKVGANYQADAHTLIYANISKGYKAGSFPSLAAAASTGLDPVTQESVTSYEAGVKAQMFDRKVQLNAAAFYYDYKNKQVRSKLFDRTFGDLDALVNVPKSRIWGLEGDVTAHVAEGLTLTGSVTYLNSKVLNYTGITVLGQQNVNFAGDPLPFTPQWSGQIDLDYRTHLDNGGVPFIGLTAHFQSDSDAVFGAHQMTTTAIQQTNACTVLGCVIAPGVTQPYVLNAYTTLDARLGYEAAAGWRVELWGKNITNKYYWTNVVPANDSAARLAAMPATYGVTFGFKFK